MGSHGKCQRHRRWECTMKERRQYYKVEEGEEGLLSEFLRRKAALSRHQIRSLKFTPQGICVNGAQARVSAVLKAGDSVSILLERAEDPVCMQSDRDTKADAETINAAGRTADVSVDASADDAAHLTASAAADRAAGVTADAAADRAADGAILGNLDILYEDRDLLVVNKPAGIVMHPSHGHFGDTLSDMAAAHYSGNGERRPIRSVGRLDKDTSGVVILAKNRVAAERLSRKGSCEKEYLAVCRGHLKEEQEKLEIHLPMRRVPGELNRMEVCPEGEGMEAHTYAEKIRECGANDLLRVRITTGRTHQIRVHLAAIGHPLAGDTLYGNRRSADKICGIRRAALHCAKVRFRHPFSEEQMEIEAPLPEDMKRLIWTNPEIYSGRI